VGIKTHIPPAHAERLVTIMPDKNYIFTTVDAI
jgi:hypothetical protein